MNAMARTLALMAAFTWLTLLGAGVAAEPPPDSAPTKAESAEPRIAAADLPATAAESPAATAGAPRAASPADGDNASAVKEVTLDPTVKPPVCRRYVPTGSRIATEVCQSAEVTDSARAAERDQARRDIDEMRMRQATRDAARAAAQAEALRRSAGF
jgi:hypothetical protein